MLLTTTGVIANTMIVNCSMFIHKSIIASRFEITSCMNKFGHWSVSRLWPVDLIIWICFDIANRSACGMLLHLLSGFASMVMGLP